MESFKFWVIPKRVRGQFGLAPGQPPAALRGFLKGGIRSSEIPSLPVDKLEALLDFKGQAVWVLLGSNFLEVMYI